MSQDAMTVKEARDLAYRLFRKCGKITIETKVITYRDVEDYSLENFGRTRQVDLDDPAIEITGPTGTHTLWLSVTSKARLQAHFDGFCVANHVPGP